VDIAARVTPDADSLSGYRARTPTEAWRQ
jgi:hypothetical protein